MPQPHSDEMRITKNRKVKAQRVIIFKRGQLAAEAEAYRALLQLPYITDKIMEENTRLAKKYGPYGLSRIKQRAWRVKRQGESRCQMK